MRTRAADDVDVISLRITELRRERTEALSRVCKHEFEVFSGICKHCGDTRGQAAGKILRDIEGDCG